MFACAKNSNVEPSMVQHTHLGLNLSTLAFVLLLFLVIWFLRNLASRDPETFFAFFVFPSPVIHGLC